MVLFFSGFWSFLRVSPSFSDCSTKDLFVGQTVVIAAQPLRITRADEHCLQYLEARTS